MGNKTLAGPGLGWDPDTIIINAINRAGATVVYGDHVQMDLASTDGDVSEAGDTAKGATDWPLANFVDPDAIDADVNSIHCGIFGAVIDPAGIANDATGRIMLRGLFDDTDGDGMNGPDPVVKGGLYIAAATNKLVVAATDSDAKIIAIALETDDDHTSSAQCLFDGINGFGFTGDSA